VSAFLRSIAILGNNLRRQADSIGLSKSHSPRAARNQPPSTTPPTDPIFGQNSRLSLYLVPPGLTSVASYESA